MNNAIFTVQSLDQTNFMNFCHDVPPTNGVYYSHFNWFPIQLWLIKYV